MFLEKLELHCFRNYTRFCFSPSLKTLIVGDNGRGKSNLLEALFLLSSGGRSFRACSPESLIKEGSLRAHISAWIHKEEKTDRVDLFLDPLGQKTFLINEKKTRANQVSTMFPAILFSPESLNLLKGSADQRRGWLDHWLIMTGKAFFVQEFKKALQQKNSVLKKIRAGELFGKKAKTLMQSVNELFMEKSLNLMRARKESLRNLNVFLEESGALIFGSLKNIRLSYRIKGLEGLKEGENEEPLFKKKVEKSAVLEQSAGFSLYGAQRDDFVLFFKGKDSRYFCSQGEQRGLLFSLKTAQVLWFHRVRENACLLLLDDVFSEIDKQMVFNLLGFLESIPSQTVLTSTKTDSFLNKKRFQVFHLKKGILRKDFSGERRDQTLFRAGDC